MEQNKNSLPLPSAADKKTERIFYWDNVRGILIALVVFGHLLEQASDGSAGTLYKFIYLFHMPLFVFCSGYFASYSPGKILKRLLLPYLVLQLVCGFVAYREIQITTPFWILWYLLALAIWRVTVPFLERCPRGWSGIVIAASVVFSCFIGYDDNIGYFATLSRVIVFYPYFVTGYYSKRWRGVDLAKRPPLWLRILSAVILTAAFAVFIFVAPRIDAKWLYNSYSYKNGNYDILFRLINYTVASIVGLAVLTVTPRRKTLVSDWGYTSFTIYILHILMVYGVQLLFGRITVELPFQYAISAVSAVFFCAVVSFIRKLLSRKYPKIDKYLL